jgi:protein-S-isoprenylcysteine O-methyltransferase Ste14
MKVNTSTSVIIRIFLWFVILFGGAALAIYQDWQNPLFRSFYFHFLTFLLGIIVTTLAFRAAANGGRELKKGRVGDIPRLETNKLITTGIYSCMRHPMLFGLTLLPLGWALLLGSPTFITIIAPLEMIFIVLMVLIFEEMEVKKKYTHKYENSEIIPLKNSIS